MANYGYLMHFGIMGQKWGVRRWQNKDGSLTPEGRIHYGLTSEKLASAKPELDRYVNQNSEFMKSYADNAQNFLKSMNKKQRDKFVTNVANKIEKTVKSSKDYEDPDEQGGFKYHMYFDDDTITDAFIVELENNGIRYPIEQHNANADIIDKSLTSYVNNALGDIGNEKISGRSKTVSDWEKNILRLEVGGSKGDWYINAKASSKISNLETDTMYSMLGDYATKDAHEHYDIMSEVDELLYSKGIYLYD